MLPEHVVKEISLRGVDFIFFYKAKFIQGLLQTKDEQIAQQKLGKPLPWQVVLHNYTLTYI